MVFIYIFGDGFGGFTPKSNNGSVYKLYDSVKNIKVPKNKRIRTTNI